VIQRFADRRGGVDPGLLQRAQPAAAGRQHLQGAGSVEDGAEGAVQLPDDDQAGTRLRVLATASELQQPAPFLATAQVIGTGVIDERAGIGGALQVEQVFPQGPKLRLRVLVLVSSRDTSVERDVHSASLEGFQIIPCGGKMGGGLGK